MPYNRDSLILTRRTLAVIGIALIVHIALSFLVNLAAQNLLACWRSCVMWKYAAWISPRAEMIWRHFAVRAGLLALGLDLWLWRTK